MVLNLAVLYLFLAIINILYIKRDKNLPRSINFIVVLSATHDSVTIKRLQAGIDLLKKHPKATIAICGREKAKLMEDFLKNKGVSKMLAQDKSINTLEDAIYLKNLLSAKSKSDFILVTSGGHQRRAYHSFKKVFKGKIWNCPTNDFFSFYSPLLPTGWMVNIGNIFKDIKYNRKFL